MFLNSKTADGVVTELQRAYNYLLERKAKIESDLDVKLDWWSSENWKSFYINHFCSDPVSIYDESTWEKAADFHAEWVRKFYDVFVPLLREWDAAGRP